MAVKIVDAPPLCFDVVEIANTLQMFSPEIIEPLGLLISNGNYSTIKMPPLCDQQTLTNPIRGEKRSPYKFCSMEVFDFKCGTVEGTLQILKTLIEKQGGSNEKRYVFLVVDYDPYWRITKLMYSLSFTDSLKTVKERVILFQGPWHIFKTLSNSTWACFAPLILGDLWLSTNRFRCLNNAPLNEQLPFWIYLYSLRDEINKELDHCNGIIKKCLKLLFFHYIPLVSYLFQFYI